MFSALGTLARLAVGYRQSANFGISHVRPLLPWGSSSCAWLVRRGEFLSRNIPTFSWTRDAICGDCLPFIASAPLFPPYTLQNLLLLNRWVCDALLPPSLETPFSYYRKVATPISIIFIFPPPNSLVDFPSALPLILFSRCFALRKQVSSISPIISSARYILCQCSFPSFSSLFSNAQDCSPTLFVLAVLPCFTFDGSFSESSSVCRCSFCLPEFCSSSDLYPVSSLVCRTGPRASLHVMNCSSPPVFARSSFSVLSASPRMRLYRPNLRANWRYSFPFLFIRNRITSSPMPHIRSFFEISQIFWAISRLLRFHALYRRFYPSRSSYPLQNH